MAILNLKLHCTFMCGVVTCMLVYSIQIITVIIHHNVYIYLYHDSYSSNTNKIFCGGTKFKLHKMLYIIVCGLLHTTCIYVGSNFVDKMLIHVSHQNVLSYNVQDIKHTCLVFVKHIHILITNLGLCIRAHGQNMLQSYA